MSPKWSSAHMTALFMHMSNLGYAITSRDDNLDKWVPGISVGEGGEGGENRRYGVTGEPAGMPRVCVNYLMNPPKRAAPSPPVEPFSSDCGFRDPQSMLQRVLVHQSGEECRSRQHILHWPAPRPREESVESVTKRLMNLRDSRPD